MGFAMPALIILLGAATVADLRERLIPAWLTFGGIIVGLLVSAANGPSTLAASLIGMTVGALLLLPFVALGGFGLADALLLAAIGAWKGWQFVLLAAWWAAICGAVLAAIAWRRGQRTFPYVPAILLGAVLALVVPLGTW